MANEFSAMSRRGFLCFAGKTAAVSTGILLSGCAQTATQATGDPAAGLARAIDIHHHYFPPELINEIKQHANALGIEYFAQIGEHTSELQSLTNLVCRLLL